MTKVLRSMPRTFFPYMFFCFVRRTACRPAPRNRSAPLERQAHGSARYPVDLAGGAVEIVAAIAEIGALRPRSAKRVQSQGVAAGGGTEVRDRLAEHFQRF